jgi:hypothetical protein
MTTAEQVRELLFAGQWYVDAPEFTIDRETVEQAVALVGDLEKVLIDCQEYSARRDMAATEYKDMLDRMLAKDGVMWSPESGLSIIRG